MDEELAYKSEAVRPDSPIDTQLQRGGMNAERLANLVGQLGNRLAPITNHDAPVRGLSVEHEKAVAQSEIAGRASALADAIDTECDRIVEILDRLEV